MPSYGCVQMLLPSSSDMPWLSMAVKLWLKRRDRRHHLV